MTENIFLVVLAGVFIFVTKHSIAANIGKSLKEVDFMELLTSYWLCQALCKPGLFNSVLYERYIYFFPCTGLYFFQSV